MRQQPMKGKRIGRIRWTVSIVVLFGFSVAAAVNAVAVDQNLSQSIREKIEFLQQTDGIQIQDETIGSEDILFRFYEGRFFKPAWRNPDNVRAMVAAIQNAHSHGLDPALYHLSPLQDLGHDTSQTTSSEKPQDADLELLLTDGFFQLAHDLSFGRINPATILSDWKFDPVEEEMAPEDLLEAALAEGRVRERLEARAPSHPLYRRMTKALARYRQIAEAGGWPSIPEGPLLEVGVRDERVPLLRQHLKITGDLSVDTVSDLDLFEPSLATAVLRYQERNRVSRDSTLVDDYDGAAGEETLAALNVPVEARIQQLIVNLERSRWLLREVPATFVLVDMADYRGYLYKNDDIIWRARVQIGTTYNQTPSFRSAIEYLVFNPTWTVPPGILRDTTLPKIRKSLSYLKKNHLMVIDRSGNRVDPTTVNWSQIKASNMPYRIVQSPGPHNAVGRVKFIFPNKHFVYLHDTPHKTQFGLDERSFSAGCIRIDKPFKLAKRLLDGPEQWTIGRIRDIIATGKTRTVFLKIPVPVLLIYRTAHVDDQGLVHFRKDVYQRDAAVLKGLAPSS